MGDKKYNIYANTGACEVPVACEVSTSMPCGCTSSRQAEKKSLAASMLDQFFSDEINRVATAKKILDTQYANDKRASIQLAASLGNRSKEQNWALCQLTPMADEIAILEKRIKTIQSRWRDVKKCQHLGAVMSGPISSNPVGAIPSVFKTTSMKCIDPLCGYETITVLDKNDMEIFMSVSALTGN